MSTSPRNIRWIAILSLIAVTILLGVVVARALTRTAASQNGHESTSQIRIAA